MMSSGNNCQPQSLTKPALGEKEAMELVDRVFGLKVSWIRPLPSYDDQNFHVRVSRNKGAAEGADEYVLKITNSEDSQEPDLIEVQTQAMMFLSAEGFPSATPCLTKDGNIMSLEAGGDVPDDWRVANVTPVYKKGRKEDPGNYRPVSLTSIPGKIMERIILSELSRQVQGSQGIRASQHGFRKGRSCLTNLISFDDPVTRLLDTGKAVDVVCLDFDMGPGNKKYMVRLLTYLPGVPVAKIPTNAQILYEIGKLAASLDKALSEEFGSVEKAKKRKKEEKKSPLFLGRHVQILC
ncbi:hydroxylysine kinase isoform 2-T5 [Alca torda]